MECITNLSYDAERIELSIRDYNSSYSMSLTILQAIQIADKLLLTVDRAKACKKLTDIYRGKKNG